MVEQISVVVCPLFQITVLSLPFKMVLPCSLLWKIDGGNSTLTFLLVQFRDVTQSLSRKHLLGPLERKCVLFWVATWWDVLFFYCLNQEQILEAAGSHLAMQKTASLRKEAALRIVQKRDGKLWVLSDITEPPSGASFSLQEKPFTLRFCYLKLKHFKWI